MIKHCFIVTSAVASKFGVYTPDQRMNQTLLTVASLRNNAPGCKIILMDCSGTPLTMNQVMLLQGSADVFINYTNDPDVRDLYESDNWDIVKNTTEIMCFARVLQAGLDSGVFKGYDRIHKMSGRYVLNDDFNLAIYEQYKDRIIIGPKHTSQFPFATTGIQMQYMARLWSWPLNMTERILQVYNDSFVYVARRISEGGYADIEHVLYKFLPVDAVTEIPLLGVEGTIAPNGAAIKN